MESGFSKYIGVVILLIFGLTTAQAQYQVKATALTNDVKDLSQRNSKVLDQNGERCALIKFETPLPTLFTFNLGAQQIEKRENKDDEVWIWVSPDVKKMTIRCTDCTPLKDYRVSLKGGNVYRAKLTTGLPKETATVQNVQIYCEQTPFFVSIDGAAPVESEDKTWHTVLPIGAHDLAVSAKLYKTYSGSMRVLRSKAYLDTIRLENNFGEVFFSVSPTGYSVLVNDEVYEDVRSLRLEPGHYKMTIRKERYEPYEVTLDVALAYQHLVKATLNPLFTSFAITAAEEETEIWIDGTNRGRGKATIELEYGEHKLEARRDGYDTWEYTTTDFNALTPRAIKIPKLNRQYGAMRVSFYPPEAAVFVDGKPVRSQEGVYVDPHIATGIHYVQARLTDYKSVRDSFTVENGKMYVRDFVLDPIALGIATITTDPNIGIYRRSQDNGELIFLGHTTFTGKLPAGENIIEVRNLSGIGCQYKLFLNDKEQHDPVKFPFQRKLMVRANVVGEEVTLKGGPYPAFPIKTNKKLNIEPMKYEITATKKGYVPFKDSIDLTDPKVEKLVARVTMRKETDTIARPRKYQSPHFLQRFYDNAGILYVGIFDLGYTFDFNGRLANDSIGFNHILTFGVLPLRYRIVGLNIADFEVCLNDPVEAPKTICYVPKLSVFIPADHGFAARFYGGFAFNIWDDQNQASSANKKAYILGGAALRFNYVGKFPVDVFAEYKWPIRGIEPPTENTELYFRVGMSFSVGLDF